MLISSAVYVSAGAALLLLGGRPAARIAQRVVDVTFVAIHVCDRDQDGTQDCGEWVVKHYHAEDHDEDGTWDVEDYQEWVHREPCP